ncbi:MAG: DUF3460 family protein [Denitromonas halophila]|nr:MAG: DUF3460 family protein [Denitromonas halophila]TVT68057.1 MAG: DUF3460 family protein [Denitromonas halophila]TVT76328.1 MAG: DUF3460 family protein [Denitromonas halophila]
MALYESEHTKFMREWMANHPQEKKEQQAGRALWWDKQQDADARARKDAAEVPTKPYYYQTD